MTTNEKVPPLEGPPSYDNWKALLRGEPSRAGFEFPVYTDAWLTGEVQENLGPYRFFTVLAFGPDRDAVRTRAVLRFELHVQYPDPDMSKTNVGYYHGGFASDEVVALASLLTGIRLAAGTESRRFDPGGDPRGRPSSMHYRPQPVLTLASYAPVLPGKRGEQSIMPVVDLVNYPKLPGSAAVALVRAARLYQDALWIAEAQPNLAWLMLVGAIETAANYWRSAASVDPLERIEAANPAVANLLQQVDGEIKNKLARQIAHLFGATRKFKDFLLAFLPAPPESRPRAWAQVEWSIGNLSNAFSQIYGHRSRALHTGIPFPASMCEPPAAYEVGAVVSEKPSGMSYLGGTWVNNDAPMCLHTFEYIARNALLKWWKSLAG